MNAGKRFEQDIKNSMPENVFYYRLKDGTGAWGGGDNVRFQSTNICDCIVYDSHGLYLFELKSHKGKSIPFTCIRESQLKQMNGEKVYPALPYYIFNMRDVEETYCIHADDVSNYINTTDRKSIPIVWMQENGYKVQQSKKRVRYNYDIHDMLFNIL